jgi:hypothetical protein
MAADGTTEMTTARGGMARQQRQGTAWQQGAGQLPRQQHRRWHKENGGSIAHGQLCWLREWDQQGIKEIGKALLLLPRNRRSHTGCPGIFITPLSLQGARIFNNGIAFDNQRRDKQDASA